MLLKEFLNKNGIRYKWFASRLGISVSYFSEIVNLKKIPNTKLAKKIEKLTGGQVSRLEVLYPEEYLSKTTSSLPVAYQYSTGNSPIEEKDSVDTSRAFSSNFRK